MKGKVLKHIFFKNRPFMTGAVKREKNVCGIFLENREK